MLVPLFALLLTLLAGFLGAFERNIAVLIIPEWYGECSFANRMKIAGERLNWNVDVVDVEDKKTLAKNKYDFVVSLVPKKYKRPDCKNYLAIFHPVHHYFDKRGYLRDEFLHFDGYLLTYPVDKNQPKSFRDPNQLPYMLWYPTVQKQPARQVDPSHLFFICSTWGNRATDIKYQKFLSLLDEQSYTRFYGNERFKSEYKSYVSSIPFKDDSLYEIEASEGICLVLHSNDHLTAGLPSGRIFEAAASSAVIISDKNRFVVEHFGDSALYIDVDKDAKTIFNQINSHYQSIVENKKKAIERGKKAYSIFMENFALEDQLIRLGEFHDRLSR